MRILFVEDDGDYAAVAQSYLKRLFPEVTVRHVTSLAEARSLATTESFDVCLLDLNLPDSHGTATVTAMVAAVPHLPLVVLTAETTGEVDMQVLQSGAEEYLAKNELGVAALRRAVRYARERHRLKRSLAQTDQLGRLILSCIPDTIELLDGERRVQFINRAGLEALGEPSSDAILGRPWLQLWHSSAAAALASLLEQADSGQSATLQAWLARAGGTPRWWRIQVIPVQQEFEPLTRYLVVAQDVTEQRHREERLYRSRQAELLKHIAGGIAHNFNNLLTIVQGYSEMMLRTLPEQDSRQRRRAADIRQAALRGRVLVERLLAYGHFLAPNPRVINLNTFLDQEAQLLEKTLNPLISLRFAVSNPAPQAYADPSLLSQVLLSLLLNASDAMPQGGVVTLATSQVELDGEAMARLTAARYRLVGDTGAIFSASAPVRFSKLSVIDAGTGMDAETLNKLFTPFFTTKPVDKAPAWVLSRPLQLWGKWADCSASSRKWVKACSLTFTCRPTDQPQRGTARRPSLPTAKAAARQRAHSAQPCFQTS
ncbi:MAG: response regulator [Chloracidobacterium sp.]|nr:response regulator [Chloracidobacterium sp.]MDW8217606.1 response regulator [Acidobacteriota bacterium]